jgi:hypothetical protein
MASRGDYTSRHSWELYSTAGTVEDWSCWATGGYACTVEIGESGDFHPLCGTKEPYALTCKDPSGKTVATADVHVDRGQTADLGDACSDTAERQPPAEGSPPEAPRHLSSP